MAKEPIELFPTLSDTYPQPTGTDIAEGLARAGLAAIPLLGGSITELLSLVLSPAVQRRRDDWFKDLAIVVENLEKTGLNKENLAQDEAFVSATVRATRIALGTHQREKRELLRGL